MTALSPLSQQEVVRFDVGVDDVDAMQLLHHMQNTGGEVHDQRLGHHLVAQVFVKVHCILGDRVKSCQKNQLENS